MKMKFVPVVLLLSSCVSAFCQVPKKVVAEIFTNSRCSICASKDPGIFRAIHYFSSDVIQIAYYPSSPYANCFFSMQNATENDARTNYYNTFGSTPDVFLQGIAASNNLDTNIVKPFLNQTTDFEIRLTHASISNDSGTITCSLTRRGNDTLQSAKIFVAVQEDSIDYNAPNGTPRHYGVFRKSITATQGDWVNLPTTIGDSISISHTYAFNAGWNKNLLSAFAILQKNSDRSIVQGAKEKLTYSGINNVADVSENGVRVYPNPVIDRLMMNVAGNYTSYEIYSAIGERIESGPLYENSVSTSHLQNGMYFIRFVELGRAGKAVSFLKIN